MYLRFFYLDAITSVYFIDYDIYTYSKLNFFVIFGEIAYIKINITLNVLSVIYCGGNNIYYAKKKIHAIIVETKGFLLVFLLSSLL